MCKPFWMAASLMQKVLQSLAYMQYQAERKWTKQPCTPGTSLAIVYAYVCLLLSWDEASNTEGHWFLPAGMMWVCVGGSTCNAWGIPLHFIELFVESTPMWWAHFVSFTVSGKAQRATRATPLEVTVLHPSRSRNRMIVCDIVRGWLGVFSKTNHIANVVMNSNIQKWEMLDWSYVLYTFSCRRLIFWNNSRVL